MYILEPGTCHVLGGPNQPKWMSAVLTCGQSGAGGRLLHNEPIMNAPVLQAGEARDGYSALKFSIFLFGVDQRPLFIIFFPEFT